jgi:hypothetical protein
MCRVIWLLVAGLSVAACGGDGSSSGGDGGSGADPSGGATSSGGSSIGGTSGNGCTAQVQTGTRTECDFSQGISDPDIACDDVPVYGNVPGITCGASCVDPKTTPSHCGECDHACGSGEYCDQGECAPYGGGGSSGTGGTGGSGAGGSGGVDANAGSGGSVPQVPDLVVTNFSLTRTVDAAAECVNGICAHDVRVCLDITKNNVVEISNLGYVESPPVSVGIGFEDAQQQRHECALDAPLTSPRLAPLEKWTKRDAFCCTANLALPGTYRLTVVADPDDEIAEYDENNNVGSTDLATISEP